MAKAFQSVDSGLLYSGAYKIFALRRTVANIGQMRIILIALYFGWLLSLSAAPPGVVFDHIPAATGVYIGSPTLIVLPGGHYLAAHDHFGLKSTEHTQALTAVFRSADRGKSWNKISQINGQFWSTLFAHNNELYILGTDK